MAVKTRSQIITENNTDFPDNVTQLISPADLRGQMNDTADSALFPEDIDDLDLSESDVTSTGNVTKTLAEWAEDVNDSLSVADIPGLDVSQAEVTSTSAVTHTLAEWTEEIDPNILFVNGMTALRAITPTVGRTVYLNYHTTVGDYGAGRFYGVTTGGPYTDNDGTIIVAGGDTSKAWLRIWDHITAHVGWFGAKCEPQTAGGADDYIPVKKCFDLFTSGRTTGGGFGGGTITTGIIDVGPGFNFSQPLIYGGSNSGSMRLVGHQSNAAGGQEKSLLRYIGPATPASIYFYGASHWGIENINTYPTLAKCGVAVIADNTYNHTLDNVGAVGITAGNNVVVRPSGSDPANRVFWLQVGCFLGIGGISAAGGAVAGADFEIVQVTAVDAVAGTFTANFAKDHVHGCKIGGSTASSGGKVNRCRLMCPASPVNTTLSANTTIVSGTTRLFTVTDITGITVGMPTRVGSFLYGEVVYPTIVNAGANTFEAVSVSNHFTAEVVMYPTSAILFGNRMVGTVQVSEVAFYDTYLVGGGALGTCYAGVRQIWGGNVKNFTFHTMYAANIKVAFAFEQSSGQYLISGGVSGNITETLIIFPGAHLTVIGWEDESSCMWLVGQSGSNQCQATFIGCTMQGQAPTGSTSDEMFVFGGSLTFLGCDLRNNRITNTTLPKIISIGLRANGMPHPSSLTIIGCHIANATLASMAFVWDIPAPAGGGVDCIADGTGKLTMLNNSGGWGGNVVRLPETFPPTNLSKSSATSSTSVTKTLTQWVSDIAVGLTPESLDTLVPASGGAVTQITSKATGVTLNKISGQITTHNESLAANTSVSFTFTNSKIALYDVIQTSIVSGVPDGAYTITVDAVAAGSCKMSIYNRTIAARGDVMLINFVVIKGSVS